MRIITPYILSATLAVMPLSAFAWEHRFERGVDLYETQSGNIALSLVCDPNTVYGTTVSAVLVGLGSDLEMNGDVSFRFPDLVTISAILEYGHVSKALNEDGVWPPLLEGFRAHSAVEITIGGVTQSVDLGDPMVFTCT